MAEDTGTIVWRRTFDPAARGRRRRKLLLWYGLPTAAALGAGLAFGGTGAFLGLGILLGLFGVLLVAWVELISFNERLNPELRIEGDSLVMGRKRVRIDNAVSWTTVMANVSTSVGAPNNTSHRFRMAKLLIRVPVLRDGQPVTRSDGGPAFEVTAFAWPSMSQEALDGVRVALEPHLRAPYVSVERIREL